jgi:Putative transposase DNA-binding domain
MLTEARAEFGWLRDGPVSVQQAALGDFDKAVRAFLDPKNPAKHPAPRRKNGPQGFVIRDTKTRRVSRKWGEVFVPKAGWVRFRWSRDLPKLNTAGLTRKPKARPDPAQAGAFLPNRRRQKAGLNRGILASAWGALATRSEQKAAASGCTVLYVDPRFTSQQCHACGHTAAENRDSQAVFRCVQCGHNDHADRNAARNILARGLAQPAVPAHAPGHGVKRPRKTRELAAGTTQAAA